MAGSRFCSAEHRMRYHARSARALRDFEDNCGDDDWSSNALWRATHLTPSEKKNPSADQKTTVLGLLAAAFVVLAVLGGSDSEGHRSAPRAARYTASLPAAESSPGFLSSLFPRGGSTNLTTDFHSGLAGWIAAHGDAGWSLRDGYVKPAGLRLWKNSTALSNYEFEFVGHVQRRGMSWAFRAPDISNYYASTLTIGGPGAQPNAGLVRFVVLAGRECERVELPLPLSLSLGTDYRVHLSVRGSRFLTSVNGQLVSSWTDSRLSRGGVGLFSEDGNAAAVKWASLTNQDNLLGRLASYFSILSFPAPNFPSF